MSKSILGIVPFGNAQQVMLQLIMSYVVDDFVSDFSA